MNSIRQDLRFASWMFVRRPGLSLLAAATLALGIGANISAFTLIESILLRSVRNDKAGKLAHFWEPDPETGARDGVPPRKTLEPRGRNGGMGRVDPLAGFESPVDEGSGENRDWDHVATPLEAWREDRRVALLALFGGMSFVFLVACANVSSLILVHPHSRVREMAIRRALGAGAARLLRQLVCEGLLISGAAGAVGFLASIWGIDFLKTSQTFPLPASFPSRIDTAVLAFAVVATAVGALLVVALPAARLARPALAAALNLGGRTAGSARPRFQKALAVGGLALTLTALTGAGLLLNSFLPTAEMEPGFESDHVLQLEFSLAENRSPGSDFSVRPGGLPRQAGPEKGSAL